MKLEWEIQLVKRSLQTKQVAYIVYPRPLCNIPYRTQSIHGYHNIIVIKFNLHAVPTAPPTAIKKYSLNATSTLLTWRPPLTESQNGVIREYHVELTQANTTTLFTTQEPYVLVNSLKLGVILTFRVAAFTVGMGPLSEAITIMQDIDSGTHIHSGNSLYCSLAKQGPWECTLH